MIAPFALAAVGDYGARRCGPNDDLELLFLLPDDPESQDRAGAVVTFMDAGLNALALRHQDVIGTAPECARMARLSAAAAARFATAHFLTGQYGLYASLLRRTVASGDRVNRRGVPYGEDVLGNAQPTSH